MARYFYLVAHRWRKYSGTCEAAASEDHLDVLRWALENVCVWIPMPGILLCDNVKIFQIAYEYHVACHLYASDNNEECSEFMDKYGDAWEMGIYDLPCDWKGYNIKGE